MTGLGIAVRKYIAVGLCLVYPASFGWSQQLSIEPIRASGPGLIRPYLGPEVPPIRLANSPRLGELVRAGFLHLTAQDAIALALENNIDLEVSRYNPLIATWNVTRAQAGGTLPGVPSNASQAGSVAVGQGVSGSQAAAGVSILGTGSSKGQGTNASIQQIGPITQTLDPIVQEASTFSHTSTPQPNTVQSVVQVLETDTRAHSASVQQGTLTGGSFTANYTEHYLNENAPTDVLNPSSAPNISITGQHNLLRGFGVAVNARTITVAKMNVHMSDLQFVTQVSNLVARVLDAYYTLAGAYENQKAKRTASGTADAFFKNVKEQVRLGALAPSEAINAESQAITSRGALVDAEATLAQQEIQLKSLLSRNGTGDPVLRNVHIVPTDPIKIPERDDLPGLDEMVKQAIANRTDLVSQQESEKATEVSNLGTKNGVLPTAGLFGSLSQAGLAGTARTVAAGPFTETADPYFVGGIGKALGQMFRRDFPTERGGAFFFAPIHNQQSQADYAIDQLQYRQNQLSDRKNVNQVEVDVQNYVVALQQARARYNAAVQNRILQEQLLAGEQKRFGLGSSVPYNVILQQRDLTNAQSTEIAALVSYSSARIGLDRTLGVLLTANHVSLEEARTGRVAAPPVTGSQPK
ncbi:MAG: TolC family protein [Bryobacteraceae bacterium]